VNAPPPAKKVTVPVGEFAEVTVAVNIACVPAATLGAGLERTVVVEAFCGGGVTIPPPPPPPHPKARPTMHPRTAANKPLMITNLRRRRTKEYSRYIAAKPTAKVEASPMNRSGVRGALGELRPAIANQPTIPARLATAAVVPEDGPIDVTERIEEPLAPPVRLTDEGLKEHVEPYGKLPEQVNSTVLLRLLAGVITTVVVPVCPALTTIGDGATSAKSGVFTFMATAADCVELKLESPL